MKTKTKSWTRTRNIDVDVFCWSISVLILIEEHDNKNLLTYWIWTNFIEIRNKLNWNHWNHHKNAFENSQEIGVCFIPKSKIVNRIYSLRIRCEWYSPCQNIRNDISCIGQDASRQKPNQILLAFLLRCRSAARKKEIIVRKLKFVIDQWKYCGFFVF